MFSQLNTRGETLPASLAQPHKFNTVCAKPVKDSIWSESSRMPEVCTKTGRRWVSPRTPSRARGRRIVTSSKGDPRDGSLVET